MILPEEWYVEFFPSNVTETMRKYRELYEEAISNSKPSNYDFGMIGSYRCGTFNTLSESAAYISNWMEHAGERRFFVFCIRDYAGNGKLIFKIGTGLMAPFFNRLNRVNVPEHIGFVPVLTMQQYLDGHFIVKSPPSPDELEALLVPPVELLESLGNLGGTK